MNNKEVMVEAIKGAWLLHEDGMCQTTFSIAVTSGVLYVLNHLMDEQAAHEETKALLKERMANQEGLELRLGNADRRRDEAIAARLSAEAQVGRLQSEIDVCKIYIDELELRRSILSGVRK